MLNVNSFQFNLAINDHPDVAAEVKKVTSGKLPSKESPMCVEISLKTNEVINNSECPLYTIIVYLEAPLLTNKCPPPFP